MKEFEAINRFFTRPSAVDLGIGDDAALLRVAPGHQLAVSADMSVAGTHFFENAAPFDIGWKTMAVNISDMAAMGAQPKWATLSIALPAMDSVWLDAFAQGLFACCDRFGVSLIGGDTTRGPLNVAINILGEVPHGKGLLRSGARAGDDIWVSGELGQAALWLQSRQGALRLSPTAQAAFAEAMHRPQPRVALGLALRGVAHSVLDISDGLLADLSHILNASQVGAVLDWQAIPKPDLYGSRLTDAQLQHAVLAGGDDYELCFTAANEQRAELAALAATLRLPLTRIGEVTAASGLRVLDGQQVLCVQTRGYDHFG